MKRSEKGFRKISIGEGGRWREIFGNSDCTKALELLKENCEPISGSKRQTEMI